MAANTAPRITCSGNAIHSGRHWMRSDAQNETSKHRQQHQVLQEARVPGRE